MVHRQKSIIVLRSIIWLSLIVGLITLNAEFSTIIVALTLKQTVGHSLMLTSALVTLPPTIIMTTAAGLSLRRLTVLHRQNNAYIHEINRSRNVQNTYITLLQTIIDNINYAIINVNTNGVVRLYNSAALGLLDTNRNITGVALTDLIKLIDEQGNPFDVRQILLNAKKAVGRTDLRLVYTDGNKINLRLDVIPIKANFNDAAAPRGYTIIARDITVEKTLDDERDEFISVVSHELRTPVAIAEGALSNLQFLLDKGQDVHKFASTLNDAHNQILYLGQMVNDLSTLSRAERGLYMENTDIDLENFIDTLQTKYVTNAAKRNLTLVKHVDVKGLVKVSSMALEEIMQNIIENAIKYTPSGTIDFGVRPAKSTKRVEFFVRDTGVGISKSDIKHIFQRFWRSEDYRTRKTSGTGLGLYVVEQLARKINCKIYVTSTLGKGTEFCFSLPYYK